MISETIRRYLYFLILFASSVSYSQTGPAGVGNSTNNIIWLDAADIAQGNNTDVNTWTDKSGNTLSFVDTGNGNPPNYLTDGGNGLPAVEFDDANAEHLVLSAYADMATSEISTIIVFATANNGEAIISYAVPGESNEYLIFDANNIRTYVTGGNNAGGSLNDGATTYNVFTTTWQSVDGALRHFKNSTNVNTGTISSGDPISAGGTLVIGGEQDSEDGGYDANQDFEGRVAEVIMYDSRLNDGERVVIENYLSAKYGIAISQDYFGNYADYDSNYDDDLRGIGTGNGTDLHTVSGYSSGLQIEALSQLDNSNEFAILAHDNGVAHASGSTANIDAADISAGDITERWAKDYYIEVSQNGTVDAATIETEFTFDFSEAGLTYSGSVSDYVLLFRATTSDDFNRVFATSYSLENTDQIVVTISPSRFKSGYYTLGKGAQIASRTWYVLQNGDWSDPATWTLDAGSAPIPKNDLNEIPDTEDDVVIRNGKMVTIQPGNDDLVVASITVNGTLDLTTSTGHNFKNINGRGIIRMSGNTGLSNFPDGSTTNSNGFGNAANGGLLVVEDAVVFDQDKTFKDIRIRCANVDDSVKLGADLTVNGNFNVRKGTFVFGDGTTTNRTLSVLGDVTIENNGGSQNGQMGVITSPGLGVRHEFDLYGDFLNEGTAQFSKRTTTSNANWNAEDTDGVVDFNLLSTVNDQAVDCNGPTYFYRIEIDKGSVDFTASIQADDPSNFVLTGYAHDNVDNDVSLPSDNQNALGLIKGTVRIGTNVLVERLNNTGNYSIGSNAKLLIDGGKVAKTGGAAVTPYGVIEVKAGILEIPSGSGITTRESGQLLVSGGEVWIAQLRTSIQGISAQGGFQQDGGVVNVWNYSVSESPIVGTSAQSAANDYARFCLTYEGNTFAMSGGTLNVKDATNSGLIFINSDPENINVTGGTVNAYSSTTASSEVASNAPFWNFRVINENTNTNSKITFETLTCGPGGANNRTITDPDLTVLNDLVVETGVTRNTGGDYFGSYLDLCPSGNCTDIAVGGSLTLQDSTVLDLFSGNADNAGSAVLTFNSTTVATLIIGDITSYSTSLTGFIDPEGSTPYQDWEHPFYDLIIDKPNSRLTLAAGGTSYDAGNTTPISDGSGNKNINTTRSNLIKVANDFTLESGEVDLDLYSIRLYGAITNKGIFGLDADPINAQVKTREETSPNTRTIFTEEGSEFGNLRINSGEGIIEFTSDVYVKRLLYKHGRINIGTHNLRVDNLVYAFNTSEVVGSDNSVEDMIIMDGNASDGGLTLYVGALNNPGIAGHGTSDEQAEAVPSFTDPRVYNFPIGTGTTGTYPGSRYTPANIRLNTFYDDGYITVNVVDGQLQTAGPHPLGNDVLNRYWRIRMEGFDTPPLIDRYRLHATEADLPDGTNDTEMNGTSGVWRPGYVLEGGGYTRTAEENAPGTSRFDDGNAADEDDNDSGDADNEAIRILFFGEEDGSGSGPTPFSLVEANYSAGLSTKFTGSPDVYYTTNTARRNWNNQSKWSLTDDGVDDGNTGVPGVGDVAVIKSYGNPNQNHWVNVNSDITLAELIFDHDLGGWLPRAWVTDRDAILDLGPVSGEGSIYLEVTATQIPSFEGNTDLGGFSNEANSEFNFKIDSDNQTVDMPSNIGVYPNLRIEAGNGNGDDDNRILRTSIPITINGRVQMDRSPRWRINHDVIIKGDLRITWQENRTTVELGDDREVTVDIGGNLRLENGSGNDAARLIVKNDNQNGYEHRLIVRGGIEIESNLEGTSTLDLYNGAAPNNNAILELAGTGDFLFENNSAGTFTPDLFKIVMNKGADTTATFTFSNDFDMPTPTDIGAQPVEIVNGLLIFDDPDIDVTLADGTVGNFHLPNLSNPEASSGSGGLEIGGGIVKISGDDTGIILDGLLRASGGTIDMSITGDNSNNFIEYGASGNAHINVSAGSLLVGSQVRRKLTSLAGLLKYEQSGGIAEFGVEGAPESTRGVFELLNSGSEFLHTGGDFTLVSQNGSTSVGSLIIKPDPADINVAGSTITIGNADTPANQDNIGIDVNRTLNNLLITGNNSLTTKIYNTPLSLLSITIEADATLNANGYDLTVNGDFINNGNYTHGGTEINEQTTYFPANTAQQISGTGITSFYNVQKSGSGTLTLVQDMTVTNDMILSDGTVNTDTYALNIEGDLEHDAIHTSDAAGPGIIFNGSESQNLDTNIGGVFGVLTLDNANGLEIPGDGRIFEVDDKVVIASGVFNIGGNLLIMDEDAIFENGSGGTGRTDFNVNSMISVNASITDNGVRKIFSDSYSGTYLYPVGLNYYTPAEINVTGIVGTSGDDSQLTIKPIEDIAGGIPDDSDETCHADASDYVDLDNILHFYWLIRSANVTDFDGSIFLYHVDALESFDNTQGLDLTNYAPARLLDASSTWDKSYSEAQFDETNNVSRFQVNTTTDYTNFTSADIAGTYTAGITRDDSDLNLCGGAIPDVVPEYVTEISGSGDVDQLASFSATPDGTPPGLGESPDLRIAGNYTLNLTDQFWRFRKVTIESGATLTVSGAGVNLGTVVGEGTLKLINTNNLPAGDYASYQADEACTTGGGFEMEVTTGNSVDVTLPFNKLRRLILSGDGEKVITNGTTFNICENLEILDGGVMTMGDNSTFNIQGNVIKDPTATFDGDFNNARIVMLGSTQQQIDGQFTGAQKFTSLEIDNASGLTVINTGNDDVEVEDLILTNGVVNTDADNSLIVVNTGDITGNFSSSAMVNGPLIRELETTTDANLFPVGDGTAYLPFEVSNTLGYVGTKNWTVQYHNEDPATSTLIANVNSSYDYSTWNGESNDANSKLYREDLFEVSVSSPATADVRPYWDVDANVGSDEDDWQYLRVMVWDAVDETWESYGNNNLNYSGMTSSSGSIISDTDLSFSTNYVTLGTVGQPVPLPVELIAFTARLNTNSHVELDWATASELNNDKFIVQHSVDGKRFDEIGEIAGKGTTSLLQEYHFKHRRPKSGINYYRLKQIDFDGQYEYSWMVSVTNNQVFERLKAKIFPNPVEGQEFEVELTNINAEQKMTLTMCDMHGKQYYFEELTPEATSRFLQINLGEKPPGGVYLLMVQQGINKQIVRMIVR